MRKEIVLDNEAGDRLRLSVASGILTLSFSQGSGSACNVSVTASIAHKIADYLERIAGSEYASFSVLQEKDATVLFVPRDEETVSTTLQFAFYPGVSGKEALAVAVYSYQAFPSKSNWFYLNAAEFERARTLVTAGCAPEYDTVPAGFRLRPVFGL